MLHFNWLRGPWWRVDIFWYNRYSGKDGSFAHKHKRKEKRKPLQRSLCKKAITMKLLQSDVVFFQPFRISFSWEFEQFSFSLLISNISRNRYKTAFSNCNRCIALDYRADQASSVGTWTSGNNPGAYRKKNPVIIVLIHSPKVFGSK